MTIDFHVDNLVVATINGNAPLSNPMTTKGDLIAGGASGAPARLAVGADGYVLTADSSQTDGVHWAAPTGGGGAQPPINPQTGTTYTLALTDAPSTSAYAGIVTLTNAAAITLTVPTTASVAFPAGTMIQLIQLGVGQVTVVGDTGVSVNSAASLIARAQFSVLVLTKLATGVWILSGDML